MGFLDHIFHKICILRTFFWHAILTHSNDMYMFFPLIFLQLYMWMQACFLWPWCNVYNLICIMHTTTLKGILASFPHIFCGRPLSNEVLKHCIVWWKSSDILEEHSALFTGLKSKPIKESAWRRQKAGQNLSSCLKHYITDHCRWDSSGNKMLISL
jgi:hypothetical protein